MELALPLAQGHKKMTTTVSRFQAKATYVEGPGTLRSASCHDRILGRLWSPSQLLAVAAKDQEVQQNLTHMEARIALANYAGMISTNKIRHMVVEIMGGVAGTYYMVAALHLALLALAFPEMLTQAQHALLLAPLEAAEQETEWAPAGELFAA
jgi:hypothetical protein